MASAPPPGTVGYHVPKTDGLRRPSAEPNVASDMLPNSEYRMRRGLGIVWAAAVLFGLLAVGRHAMHRVHAPPAAPKVATASSASEELDRKQLEADTRRFQSSPLLHCRVDLELSELELRKMAEESKRIKQLAGQDEGRTPAAANEPSPRRLRQLRRELGHPRGGSHDAIVSPSLLGLPPPAARRRQPRISTNPSPHHQTICVPSRRSASRRAS